MVHDKIILKQSVFNKIRPEGPYEKRTTTLLLLVYYSFIYFKTMVL